MSTSTLAPLGRSAHAYTQHREALWSELLEMPTPDALEKLAQVRERSAAMLTGELADVVLADLDAMALGLMGAALEQHAEA